MSLGNVEVSEHQCRLRSIPLGAPVGWRVTKPRVGSGLRLDELSGIQQQPFAIAAGIGWIGPDGMLVGTARLFEAADVHADRRQSVVGAIEVRPAVEGALERHDGVGMAKIVRRAPYDRRPGPMPFGQRLIQCERAMAVVFCALEPAAPGVEVVANLHADMRQPGMGEGEIGIARDRATEMIRGPLQGVGRVLVAIAETGHELRIGRIASVPIARLGRNRRDARRERRRDAAAALVLHLEHILHSKIVLLGERDALSRCVEDLDRDAPLGAQFLYVPLERLRNAELQTHAARVRAGRVAKNG